jgi:hypothetical protein
MTVFGGFYNETHDFSDTYRNDSDFDEKTFFTREKKFNIQEIEVFEIM